MESLFGMLTTQFRTESYPMPTCAYSLHRGSPDGPLVRFAVVGQPVYHKWECTEHDPQHDVYGMLVHSCYVDDSNGDIVFLLDEQGCGIDIHLLGTPQYSNDLKLAFRESHSFKYADRPFVNFQCQITVCYKHDGGCRSITPPKCRSPPYGKRRRGRSVRYNPEMTMDVLTQSVNVLDVDADKSLGDFLNQAKEGRRQDSSHEITCVGHHLIVVTGTVMFFVYTSVVVTVIFAHSRWKANREKE